MPKIQDYGQTQYDQPADVEQSYAPLINNGAAAENVKSIGDNFEKSYNLAYQKTSQAEVSDINSKFADARADWAVKIDQQTKDGTIDVGKLRDEYENSVSKMQGDIQTDAGQNYFNRQAARLSGFITKNASRGQAQAVGIKAQSDWRNATDKNTSVLQNNPESFQDIHQSTIEGVDAQVATGVLSLKDGERLKHETGVELARNAIAGYANQDPQLAREKLKSPEFDMLSGDDRTQLNGHINQVENANEIEQRRAEMAKEKAQKLAGEAWEHDNVKALSDGTLDTKSILNAPGLSAEKQIQWMRMQDEFAKKQNETDPKVFNDLTRRVLLPPDDPQKISTISDLAPYAGKGMAIGDVEKLATFMQKTPEGENLRDNRKRLMDLATAKLVKKDPMMGIADPDGEYNMAQFQIALQNAEKQAQKDKVNVAQLYDPNDKNHYFGNQIEKYHSSPQEIMARMAGQSQNGAVHGPGGNEAPKAEEMVNVISPTGARGRIPKSKLDKAKASGFKAAD